MKGRKEEMEVIVRLDQLEGKVHICVGSWPAMKRKMERLYGPSLDHNRGGQSERWVIPMRSISFRRIPAPGTPRRTGIGGFKRTNKPQSGENSAEIVPQQG